MAQGNQFSRNQGGFVLRISALLREGESCVRKFSTSQTHVFSAASPYLLCLFFLTRSTRILNVQSQKDRRAEPDSTRLYCGRSLGLVKFIYDFARENASRLHWWPHCTRQQIISGAGCIRHCPVTGPLNPTNELLASHLSEMVVSGPYYTCCLSACI